MPLFSKKSPVVAITPNDFDSNGNLRVEMDGRKGMIFFGAPWCGWCKKAAPDFDTVANLTGGGFKMFSLDCSKYGDFAQEKFRVQGYPTFSFVDKFGKLYKNYQGERTVDGFLQGVCTESLVCPRRK
jgi:thiol-disulfide isomerase/thioredoxin